MPSDGQLEELESRLSTFGQVHLLRYWQDLNYQERLKLQNQIDSLDLRTLINDFNVALNEFRFPNECKDIEPIPDEVRSSAKSCSDWELKLFWENGIKAIQNGEVAVIVLAGGQGSRLGVEYPKGLYDVGLPSRKSLFHIQAERIIRLKQLASKKQPNSNVSAIRLPWFIMTSDHTLTPTKQFFEKYNFFGLPERDVIFFEQDEMPSFSMDGKIIMSDKCNLFKAPDGNGGMFGVLKKLGLLDQMRTFGIKYVHVYCVDNILVKVADPTFIGYCIERSADCAVKVVAKEDPKESVGVVCRSNGAYRIVEYSELPNKAAKMLHSTGKLAFRDGNICNHFFTVDFLESAASRILLSKFKMANHPALKKIPSIDGVVEGLKLEKFVFDVLPLSQRFCVWQVDRNEEFAPLKNNPKSGKNCTPQSCKQAILDNHAKWMPDVKEPVEISPIVSYSGEDLTDKNAFVSKTIVMDGTQYVIIDKV